MFCLSQSCLVLNIFIIITWSILQPYFLCNFYFTYLTPISFLSIFRSICLFHKLFSITYLYPLWSTVLDLFKVNKLCESGCWCQNRSFFVHLSNSIFLFTMYSFSIIWFVSLFSENSSLSSIWTVFMFKVSQINVVLSHCGP